MATMTKKLNVQFALDSGKKYTFPLTSPKDGLTKADVQVFADEVIANKGLVVNGAYPIKLGDVYIHQEEDTPVE